MNIVQDTYDKLSVLVSAGKNDEAHDFLASRMPALPTELQSNILGIMLEHAVHEEAEQLKELEAIQKEGVAAMKALVALKESLEKGGEAKPA